MAARSSIRFLRRGEVVELFDVDPNETVLDYLRLKDGSKGTKEGCCEGDCGACTVAIGAQNNDQIEYSAVNSCIQLLGTLDGKELITVDDLAGDDGTLHPVQQALVDNHGSQCGFCTPGFVMSLFVMQHDSTKTSRRSINETLAGNLCRCTGYRPIVDAANAILVEKPPARPSSVFQLLAGSSDEDIFVGTDDRFFASPVTEQSLARLCATYADAVLVAGTTDVGLWITKQQRDLPKIIYIGRVKELLSLEKGDDVLKIGAGVTYAKAQEALGQLDSELETILIRIGSKQVRNAGTIGGNIANGSPIGDMPPMLIALDASIELANVNSRRSVLLADFFVEYGKQDIGEDEYLASVKIPYLQKNQILRCYKISKRFDQDISALMAAFRFTVDDGVVSDARIVFGGMAGTPARAIETENALNGLSISDLKAWEKASEALAKDFTPMSDMRASAAYRLQTAEALIIKARAELSGVSATRILPGPSLGHSHA